MRKILFFPIFLLLLATISCNQKKHSTEIVEDHLVKYRDTIVGNFSGSQIDTLICEPIDSISDPTYKGFHYEWRVYAKNRSVDEIIIGPTIGIHFVSEGDLDGDGADEWGFVTEWETSNWMTYKVYTYKNRKGNLLYEPLAIWLPHLDPEDSLYHSITAEQIASKSTEAGKINVKFSSVRNDGEDFLVIDTIVPVLR